MTAHRGVLIEPDGTVTEKLFDTVNLQALTSAVDARLVDCVRVRQFDSPRHLHLDAWVDDEGMFTAEHNPLASYLVSRLSGHACQRLYGRALFIAGDLNTGASLGLPGDFAAELASLGRELAIIL